METFRHTGAKTVSQRAKEGPFGRNKLYQEMNEGRLRGKKAGRLTIITDEEWARYLATLPDYQPGQAA